MNENFRKMESDEECQPIMDDYRMKCCDCGLVHLVKFRAIEIGATGEGGAFEYEELDPVKFRVSMSMRRES